LRLHIHLSKTRWCGKKRSSRFLSYYARRLSSIKKPVSISAICGLKFRTIFLRNVIKYKISIKSLTTYVYLTTFFVDLNKIENIKLICIFFERKSTLLVII